MKIKEALPAYKTQRQPYTYQDYLELPDDGKRYQVINGELVMTPSPITIHQKVSGNLEFELNKFNEIHRLGQVLHAPLDVVLSEENVLQPDILFIANEHADIITDKNISGAPDLIIEILSPSTGYYDLVEKKEIYESFGVKEYWIVDPKKARVEIFQNDNNKFKSWQRVEKQGVVKSPTLTGLQISIDKIFLSS